jgi:predicted O-methyltransferase YrrM
MQYLFVFLIVCVLGYLLVKVIKYRPLYPLMPLRYNFGKRRNTFRRSLKLLDQIDAKVLVETGTSRQGLRAAKGDGAATIVFGKWAKRNGAFLHSVDINEQSVQASQREVDLQGLGNHVKVYLSDSLVFLKDFKEQVDFLYLDSYDYSKDPEVQKKSQFHHLAEFKAIEHRLHRQSVVLIDDCRLPNGGKGKMAVEYMTRSDWKVLVSAYQILLVRKDSGL